MNATDTLGFAYLEST